MNNPMSKWDHPKLFSLISFETHNVGIQLNDLDEVVLMDTSQIIFL